ncbi:MAG: helix-turn-helix domain-containing protein [Thermoguttaceae bacterium]|nr:helix-turn-helix domain-containing protein [Thermoguttaceae bacterium]
MMKLLDANEAAQYLNITVRTVEYFRVFGNLPYHVIDGKLIRFDADELKNWFLGRDHDSNNNKRKEAPME